MYLKKTNLTPQKWESVPALDIQYKILLHTFIPQTVENSSTRTALCLPDPMASREKWRKLCYSVATFGIYFCPSLKDT